MSLKKELKNYSLYYGVLFSLLAKMHKTNLFVWFLGIIFFAVLHVLVYVSYCYFMKGVLFLYGKYMQNWWETIRSGTKENRKNNTIKKKIKEEY